MNYALITVLQRFIVDDNDSILTRSRIMEWGKDEQLILSVNLTELLSPQKKSYLEQIIFIK
jgi:hypothetical protein